MKNKFKQIALFCVETIQLRNADAQTRRLIVSLTHVASGVDKMPGECYDDFNMLTEIFRQTRIEIKGDQSMKHFHDVPADFVKRYPSSYPDDAPPVECPVCKKEIKSRAIKSSIPCRSNNAKLVGQGSGTTTGRSSHTAVVPVEDATMSSLKMMAACMSFMRGEANPSESSGLRTGLKIFGKPPGQLALGDHSSSDAASAGDNADNAEVAVSLVGRKDTLPGCIHAAQKKGLGNLDSLRADIQEDLLKATAPVPEIKASVDLSEPGESAAASGVARGSVAAKRKLADETRVLKKPSSRKLPAPSKQIPDINAPAVEVLAAKTSIMKYPFALKQLRTLKKKGRPTLSKTGKPEKVHYMGGAIYPIPKGMGRKDAPVNPVLRVFTRRGDKREQRIPYKPKSRESVQQAWDVACAAIETDPREVPG